MIYYTEENNVIDVSTYESIVKEQKKTIYELQELVFRLKSDSNKIKKYSLYGVRKL